MQHSDRSYAPDRACAQHLGMIGVKHASYAPDRACAVKGALLCTGVRFTALGVQSLGLSAILYDC